MKTLAISSRPKSFRVLAVLGIALMLTTLLIVSCTTAEDKEPTEQPQPTATTVPVPTNTAVPAPTPTPRPTATAVPTATATATATAMPTPLPTATATPTVTPTPTPSPIPVPTATPIPTEIPEPLFTLLLLATGEVGSNEFTLLGPGNTELFERDFPGAPPQVPHKESDLVIDLKANACMMCHTDGLRIKEGHIAIKIPETHYTDLSTGLMSEELNLRRYICTSCHVPQVLESPPYTEQ